MSASDFVLREVVANDGVRLAAYEWKPQGADEHTPVAFLVNGLGGNLSTWRHQLRELKARGYRIVAWDYRGLYGSTLSPEDARDADVGLAAHASDAIAVLDAFGVQRAVFIGWSMGVQLNFELYRLIPERIEGIIQIAGSYGRALTTTRFGKVGRRFIPTAMGGWAAAAARFGPQIGQAMASKSALAFARNVGIVAPTMDTELAAELIHEYVRLDFHLYNRILLSLDEHDAYDTLGDIDVPVLVLAGTRDPMTPHWLSSKMAAAIPDAELRLVDKGSHYVPIEYPDQINDAIADFLERRLGHEAARTEVRAG